MSDRRRLIKPGELLAIRPDLVQEDRGAFFWLFPPPAPENERIGCVAVVTVNGPLEYHACADSDSYDAIVSRVREALEGDEESGPPGCIVLRIDSPGGVVAGLQQTVDRLRKISRKASVPFYAFADEMAYSAAYAIACACSEIYLPPSAMMGSVGVISTMVDQTKLDAKMGLRFVILTSGKRKADGHPHVPISQAMIDEEAPRVLELARQFYASVKYARGIPMKTIQGFEAGRFLGAEAAKAGLADEVVSWDRFLALVQERHKVTHSPLAQPGTRVSGSPVATRSESNMALSLDALIDRTQKAASAEKDPTKLSALHAELEAYKKTKHMIEKHETEEGEDDDEDEDEADEEDSAKGDETDRTDDEDDDEDGDDDDGEDEKKSKKAAASSKSRRAAASVKIDPEASKVLAAVLKMTGKKDAASAIAALSGKIEGANALQSDVQALKKKDRKTQRESLITRALADKRISPSQARMLGGKKLGFVEEFLAMHKSAIVQNDSEAHVIPPNGGPGANGKIPEALREQYRESLAALENMGVKDAEAKLASTLGGKAATLPRGMRSTNSLSEIESLQKDALRVPTA